MRSLILALSFMLTMTTATAQTFEEQGGLVVMEAESAPAPTGFWLGKTKLKDYTGKGYIEFNGNKPTSGPPNSPLVYTFKINQAGLYYLHMRASREDRGQRKDYSNDCYVRVIGDFGAGPNQGQGHGKDASLKDLTSNNKFFGGTVEKFSWFSGNHLDLGGEKNKRVAVYDFKAGKKYALVISGRSKFFAIDRIVFRHHEVGKQKAEDVSLEETRAERKPPAKTNR